MALVIEQQIIGEQVLVYTYSDNNKKIRQVETGILYDSACDIPSHYTYEETDIDIENVENEQSDNV